MNNTYDKLPNSPEIEHIADEAIMRTAREHPMIVMYAGDNGNTAYGNSAEGYRFLNGEGQPISADLAEPFTLTGTSFVIRHGLLGIETPEV